MSIFDKEDNITMEYLIDLGFHRFNLLTEDRDESSLILTIQPMFRRPAIGGYIYLNTRIYVYGNIFKIRREIDRNRYQFDGNPQDPNHWFEKFINSDIDILIKRETDLLWARLADQYPGMGETLKDIIYLNTV